MPATLIMLSLLLCASFLPATAHAVNFGTAVKPPPGYEFKLFPVFYSADLRTNKDGDPSVRDLDLTRYSILFGNFYQAGDLHLSVIIPVGKVTVGKLKGDDAGLGDIQVRSGWNLSAGDTSFLPALMVKLPTGSYDKNRPVNYGDGQADLVAELFVFKLLQPFFFDAAFKYNVRFRNHDSGVTPGNEFIAEGLATVRVAERVRIGPALNYIRGADNKKGGMTLANSGLMRLSAGGELYYGRSERVQVSLAGYRDVLTRNTNKGFTILSRIVIHF